MKRILFTAIFLGLALFVGEPHAQNQKNWGAAWLPLQQHVKQTYIVGFRDGNNALVDRIAREADKRVVDEATLSEAEIKAKQWLIFSAMLKWEITADKFDFVASLMDTIYSDPQNNFIPTRSIAALAFRFLAGENISEPLRQLREQNAR